MAATTTISSLTGAESIPGALRSVNFSLLGINLKTRASALYPPVGGSEPSREYSAGRSLRPEVAGSLLNNSLEVTEGHILIARGIVTTNGFPVTKLVPLVVDTRAPYNKLKLSTSHHARSVSQYLYVEGRFWLMDDDEVNNRFGYNSSLLSQRKEWKDVFSVFEPLEEMHPGAAQPVVETQKLVIDGVEKNVTVARPKRALRI